MSALTRALTAALIAALTCAAAGADSSVLKLKLYAQNRPGETGTATFEQIPAGVKIVITLAGGQNGVQPVHIHTGTCAKLNPTPTYTLNSIVRGSSTTTISDINLTELLNGKYVIDIHESSADIKRYVACAAIAMPE